MTAAFLLSDIASELALFAAAGFLLFALDDLLVDLIYFVRRLWRAATVYTRFPRAFADTLPAPRAPGRIAVFVPAWDESAVVAAMLRAAVKRWGIADFRIFVGSYRNDPATAAAIASVKDARIAPVLVDADGPTTKADCLNHLYAALVAAEAREGWDAKAVVLHDAEDLVHPLEMALFDRMIGTGGDHPAAGRAAGRSRLPLGQRPLLRRIRRGPARNWWSARRSAPRSHWPGSAAPSPAARLPGSPRRRADGRSPPPA